jgi:inorganic pyrophosphatase
MTTMQDSFWAAIDHLIAKAPIIIDRPKDSAHPRYSDMIYPLDYGYLEGTTAGDGSGIDVWLGTNPLKIANAVVCTVDLVKRDAEIKILIGCSELEIQAVVEFLEANAMGCTVIRRSG